MSAVSLLCITIAIMGTSVAGCLMYIANILSDIRKALTKEEEE